MSKDDIEFGEKTKFGTKITKSGSQLQRGVTRRYSDNTSVIKIQSMGRAKIAKNKTKDLKASFGPHELDQKS